MKGAVVLLVLNAAVSGMFALCYSLLAWVSRGQRSIVPFGISYSIGMLTPLSELGVRWSLHPSFFMATSYGTLLAGFLAMAIALSLFERHRPPWRVLAIVGALGLVIRVAIWGGQRDFVLYELAYQLPFVLALGLCSLTAFRHARRRGTMYLLAALFAAIAVDFLTKPFVAALVGSGRSARDYVTSDYALYSQASTGILLVAAGLVVLLVVVQATMHDFANATERAVSHATRTTASAQEKITMLAHVSHEIRGPISSMTLLVKALQSRSQLTEEDRKLVELLEKGGDTVVGILSDVLDFARLEADAFPLRPSTTNLSMMMSEIVESFQEEAGARGLCLSSDIAPSVPRLVEIDGDRVRQILGNLIRNALRFTDRGGVVLSASVPDATWFRLAVSDTGMGIPPEDVPTIFQPFQQVEAVGHRRGGTGLGLFICRQIVERMGGTIGVTSQVGEGSTFWFHLPL